jgi:hypothetical protein
MRIHNFLVSIRQNALSVIAIVAHFFLWCALYYHVHIILSIICYLMAATLVVLKNRKEEFRRDLRLREEWEEEIRSNECMKNMDDLSFLRYQLYNEKYGIKRALLDLKYPIEKQAGIDLLDYVENLLKDTESFHISDLQLKQFQSDFGYVKRDIDAFVLSKNKNA